MFTRNPWLVLALLLVGGVTSPVLAQDADDSMDEEDEKKVIYKKDQVINFEGLDVQGEIKKPAGAYLLDRKKSNFSPLIKFRQNWDEEAIRSLEQKK